MVDCGQREDGSRYQRIQYRLIACTRDLDPIGYCTFAITLEHEFGCAAEVFEGFGVERITCQQEMHEDIEQEVLSLDGIP